MSKRPAITYADSRHDLPVSDFAQRLAELRIARTFAEQSAANDNPKHAAEHRADHIDDRSMVEKDRPHPAPRPSPDWAADADAAGFDARWQTEHRRRTQLHSPHPQKGDQTMSDDQKPRGPEETLREGPLKAAIWRNEGENGAYHSVTVQGPRGQPSGHPELPPQGFAGPVGTGPPDASRGP